MDEQLTLAELAPLPMEEDDEDRLSAAPHQHPSQDEPPPPPPPVVPAPQVLRPDAKPFTPFQPAPSANLSYGGAGAGASGGEGDDDDDRHHHAYGFQPQRRQMRQVVMTRAHYDEEGNVVYPARVSTVQNPEIMRMIAERDMRLGYREGSKRSTGPQGHPQPVMVQTPNGPVMMMLPPPPPAAPSQQPAYAVFNKQQQPAMPNIAALPSPHSGHQSLINVKGGDEVQDSHVRSLAAALMDPTCNPPPRYVTYNPFGDSALDKHMTKSLEALLDGQDDFDGDVPVDHPSSAISEVDPLWLLGEVRRVESQPPTAVRSSDDEKMAAAAAALLGIKPALSVPAKKDGDGGSVAPIGPLKQQQSCMPFFSGHAPATLAPPAYSPLPHMSNSPMHYQPASGKAPAASPPPPPYIPPASILPLPAPPPKPAPSAFIPSLSAKPYVPSSAGWGAGSLPSYTEALHATSTQQADVSTTSVLTKYNNTSNSSVGPPHNDDHDSNTSHLKEMQLDDGEDNVAMTQLKVNPEAFFGNSSDAMHTTANGGKGGGVVRPSNDHSAASGHRNETVNPFSLQSLQGVRRTEHAVPLQQVVWQRVFFRDSETWVPPPFPPIPNELVRLHNGHKHYDVTKPLSHPNVTLHLYNYQCGTCPYTGVYPGKVNHRPADVKLGGVCGDVPALCIAHMIEVITSVKIEAIDMFGNNLGRCNLWLQNPGDVLELTRKFDRKMWMSPVFHGYAVVALDDDGREYLHWYLEGLRAYGPKAVRFPRHLVTCERWIA